jgi:hypothetical protein
MIVLFLFINCPSNILNVDTRGLNNLYCSEKRKGICVHLSLVMSFNVPMTFIREVRVIIR